LIADPARAMRMCDEAARVLATHDGATERILDMLDAPRRASQP